MANTVTPFVDLVNTFINTATPHLTRFNTHVKNQANASAYTNGVLSIASDVITSYNLLAVKTNLPNDIAQLNELDTRLDSLLPGEIGMLPLLHSKLRTKIFAIKTTILAIKFRCSNLRIVAGAQQQGEEEYMAAFSNFMKDYNETAEAD